MSTFTTHSPKSILPLFWLSLSLLIFTACLGRSGDNTVATTGDTTQLPLASQGTVMCNAACAQWGQCGDKTDNTGKVVLSGRGGPAVINHELIFPDNSPVFIDGHEVRTLQPVVGGEPMNMNFYYVLTTDGTNKGGWVAGWCVQTAN